MKKLSNALCILAQPCYQRHFYTQNFQNTKNSTVFFKTLHESAWTHADYHRLWSQSVVLLCVWLLLSFGGNTLERGAAIVIHLPEQKLDRANGANTRD